jgi:hypothetical protein
MSVGIRVNRAFATSPKGVHHSMFVTAVSTSAKPRWRWRITSPAGDLEDESRDDFATITAALEAGRSRAVEIDTVGRSEGNTNLFRRRSPHSCPLRHRDVIGHTRTLVTAGAPDGTGPQEPDATVRARAVLRDFDEL